jgi:hypothetical protein
MNIKIIVIALIFAATMGMTARAQDNNPFLGKWDITGNGQFSNYVYWLEVKMEDGKLTGRFLNRSGSVLKLPEIAMENGELIFSPAYPPNAPKPIHRARVEEGRLLGMLRQGDLEVPWIGVRPPQWTDNNKYRAGTPVILFDGKSMENWDVQNKDLPSGWSIVDSVMTNGGKANNLISKHRFEDFKIQCEYKIAEKSNSGIYLRGRYELQILDDAGKEPDIHSHMSLYSRVKPAINASLPADQWQIMEATITGNRVTVFLNGKKVHDNIVIDGITGGAIDSNEDQPGPILIQGDHGKVSFRRIVVTPLTKK